jgi:hypothetical protein
VKRSETQVTVKDNDYVIVIIAVRRLRTECRGEYLDLGERKEEENGDGRDIEHA